MCDFASSSPRHPGLDPGTSCSSADQLEPVEGAKGLRARTPSIQGMIFSTPMVKALQAGRKTQTRRLLPEGREPRLKVGDRVYVRETFRIAPDAAIGWPFQEEPCPGWIEYAAGGSHWCFAPDYFAVLKCLGNQPFDWENPPQRWRSARLAPRWTSRMYLTITDIRVQQLQDIDDADSLAEGLIEYEPTDEDPAEFAWREGGAISNDPICAYAHLWDSLNDKPGTRWTDNPRIVAYTFTVTHRNIDVLPLAPGYFAESSPAPSASAHPEPVEGVEGSITPRALIEGNVPPHIAAQLIRASDLPPRTNPQPVRKSA